MAGQKRETFEPVTLGKMSNMADLFNMVHQCLRKC